MNAHTLHWPIEAQAEEIDAEQTRLSKLRELARGRGLANALVREAARRLNAAVTLADRMDAIDYGLAQTNEANERADRITERLMPRLGAVNGFDDLHRFMEAARHNAERGELRDQVRDRLLHKIIERDHLLWAADDLSDERKAA